MKILVRVRSFAPAMTCDPSLPLRVVSPFPALVCRHSSRIEHIRTLKLHRSLQQSWESVTTFPRSCIRRVQILIDVMERVSTAGSNKDQCVLVLTVVAPLRVYLPTLLLSPQLPRNHHMHAKVDHFLRSVPAISNRVKRERGISQSSGLHLRSFHESEPRQAASFRAP